MLCVCVRCTPHPSARTKCKCLDVKSLRAMHSSGPDMHRVCQWNDAAARGGPGERKKVATCSIHAAHIWHGSSIFSLNIHSFVKMKWWVLVCRSPSHCASLAAEWHAMIYFHSEFAAVSPRPHNNDSIQIRMELRTRQRNNNQHNIMCVKRRGPSSYDRASQNIDFCATKYLQLAHTLCAHTISIWSGLQLVAIQFDKRWFVGLTHFPLTISRNDGCFTDEWTFVFHKSERQKKPAVCNAMNN